MDTQKALFLTVTSLVAVAITLLLIQLLLKTISKSGNGVLNRAFAIYFSALFLSSSSILVKSICILNEAIDNIFKIKPSNIWTEIFKTTSIYIGLSILWFLLWYIIASVFTSIITGKMKDKIEMENDNYLYFFIKGIIVFGFIICLSSVFDILLRVFIPNIQIPFYH